MGWLQEAAPVFSASAGIVTASVAIWGIFAALRDSTNRTRPAMVAEFRIAPDSDSVLDLVVRNAGASTARQVKVTFDPPIDNLPRSDEHGPFMTNHTAKRYRKTIPVVVPGQEFANIWWTARYVENSDQAANGEPTPDEVVVTIEYDGPAQGWRRTKHYRDDFPLSIESMTLTTFSLSNTSMKGRMRTLADNSSSLVAAVKSISKALNRPRDEDPAPTTRV